MAGSIQLRPVTSTSTPDAATPSDTPASDAMCRKAARTFRSPFPPRASISAEPPFTATPASDMPITSHALTGAGDARRCTASTAIAPTATSNSTALASAAMMEDERSP